MAANKRGFKRFFLLAALLGAVGAAASGPAGCARDAVDRDKSQTRLDLAKDFLGKGNLMAAEGEAQKALGYNPGNEEAHNLLGLLDLMRAQQSLQLVEIDDCLTGVDAEALRSEMDEHLLAADEHFARAAELAPSYGEPLANRGVVADLLARPVEAIDHLQAALALPARLQNIALVRANLGWAYFHQRDMVQAAKQLRQARQFQPGMCVATYRLGRVYFARKEWEKALEQFQEVTSQPGCPIQEAHLFAMMTYAELGMTARLPDAEKACVQLAPKSCVAIKCRAVAQGGAVGGARE